MVVCLGDDSDIMVIIAPKVTLKNRINRIIML